MYHISLYLNILCTISVQGHCAKKSNFSEDVNFMHAFDLKFIINANIVYIPVELKFSMYILCPNHHGRYFNSCSFAALSAFTVSCLT